MKKTVFTGSYAHIGEKGIACLEFDTETGNFTELFGSYEAECPSYVLKAPERDVLYAVRELTPEGAVYAFRIMDDSLKKINELPTLGQDPCFLSVDSESRFLVATNYSGSSLSVFRLADDGNILEMTDRIEHEGSGPVRDRQEAAHPHCAVFHEGLLYVCDLGMDTIVIYQLGREDGKLTEKGRIRLPEGTGPRHLLFSERNANILYVVLELASSVCVFDISGGEARLLQMVSALPEDTKEKNISAAIRASGDGRALFVSNRGHDSVAVFTITENGLLEIKGWCSSGGRTPRDMLVIGNCLAVADQDSDCIAVLRFDPETCELESTGNGYECIRPTCITPAM